MSNDYPMSVSITGGATPQSYAVTDGQGNKIPNIYSIDFHVEPDKAPSATINILSPDIMLQNVGGHIPVEQLIQVALAHGFLLVPQEDSAQEKMAYDSLQRFVRSHGYELVKGDSSEPFFEEP